jgi:phosphoadenosine phosphosulfate reductase
MVMTTSFGIQSAVMLHLVTQVIPQIPIIWIDTGYLPPATYRFADALTQRLQLNLKVYQSPISPARMEALHGRLWTKGTVESLNFYDQMRKVEPMQRALKDLNAQAWLAGLRGQQTDYRSQLQRVMLQGGLYKIHPILPWTLEDVDHYLASHNLPYHPLKEMGYATVGDWHSSRPMTSDDDHERDTRFQGVKQECGLHLPETQEEAKSFDSSAL